MPRYTATFSFDALDFQDARSIAREFRDTLRDHTRGFDAANAKLRKLVDPYVNDENEYDTADATA